MHAPRSFAIIGCAALLAACGTPPPAQPPAAPPAVPVATPQPPQPAPLPRYRCDNNVAFTVRFGDGTAVIDAGPRGSETLLRDAGGVTPQQTVYSSTKLKAEFGLDPEARGAKLSFASPALEARCVKE